MKVEDVCADLGIHRATWYRWVADPDIITPEPIAGIGRLKRYPRWRVEQFKNELANLSPEDLDDLKDNPARPGFVYFIGCNNKFIKIGFTNDVGRRMTRLQTGNPYKLELLGAFRGTGDDERKIHRELKALREKGEWFRPGWQITALIRQLEVANCIEEVLG